MPEPIRLPEQPDACELCARAATLTYNSHDSLLSDERLRTFVEWRASQPAGFMPRH